MLLGVMYGVEEIANTSIEIIRDDIVDRMDLDLDMQANCADVYPG